MSKVKIKALTDNINCRCGKGWFFIGQVLGDEDNKCVIHSVPYCDEFMNKSPTDFLHWHNELQVN